MNREYDTRTISVRSYHDIQRELNSLGIENVSSLAPDLLYRYVRIGNVAVATAIFIREMMTSLGGKVLWKDEGGGGPPREAADLLLVGSEAILRSLSKQLAGTSAELRSLGEALANCLARPFAEEGERLELRGGRVIDFSSRTYIMGILNVTPDSFSDGGRFFSKQKAIAHALSMIEEGVDIVDVGGESTRPGAEPIEMREELRRIIPVIERIAGKGDVIVSVDTTKARVAREALSAGAEIINDVSALRFDPEMVSVIARSGIPAVLMHMRGIPQTMQEDVHYRNLMGEIVGFLRERMCFAEERGVKKEKIIVDPGIGFGKSMKEHNFAILRNLEELACLGRPVLVGPSRKAFLGHLLHLPPDEREEGTAAAVAAAVMNGANIVRVHDVKRMKRVVRVADAIMKASPSCVQ